MDPNSPASAPWPVRKGIFRSTGQSDYIPQRTPSPIVEMPATPIQPNHSNPMSPLSPRCVTVLDARCMSPPPQSPSLHYVHASRVSPVKSPPPQSPSLHYVHGSRMSPVKSSPPQINEPPKSKLKSRMLTPINVSIREIPIEVQQEVS